MAVSSLTRFTVPLGGNQSATTQGLLMPKLKFRYRVTFEKFGVSNPKTEMTKQVMSFARPQVTFDPVEIPVYNSRVYSAGRPTWNAVQASASSGIDYKFVTTIEMLDGANGTVEPTVLEAWQLYGCFLTDVNYNDLDYGSNDPVTITMSIRYDNAIQTTGAGVGSPGLTQFNTAAITG